MPVRMQSGPHDFVMKAFGALAAAQMALLPIAGTRDPSFCPLSPATDFPSQLLVHTHMHTPEVSLLYYGDKSIAQQTNQSIMCIMIVFK